MTSTKNYSETENDAADCTESNKGGIDSGVGVDIGDIGVVSKSCVNRTLTISRLLYVALVCLTV